MTDAHPFDGDPRLPELLAWRQQLIEDGTVSASSFKEAHIRLVLRSGRTDVDQIRAMLPGSVAEHAADMARLLQELAVEPAGRHRVTDGNDDNNDAGTEATTVLGMVRPAKPAPQPEAGHRFAAEAFAPFTFGEQQTAPETITLQRRREEDGQPATLRLSWPPYRPTQAPAVVVYRLVSGEDSAPYAPDRGAHLVAGTTSTSATDDRAPASAVRHFQVWVNAGPSQHAALAGQPVLHAAGALVSPVREASVREDSGRVIGEWTVFSGVTAVYVYRVPAERATSSEPQFRILAGGDNLGGFVDTEAEGGRRYTYRVRCAVTVDGVVRLSEPVSVDVDVSAALVAVTDLSVTSPASTRSADDVVFDLAWTVPVAGRVAIFRSQDGPSAGAESAELPDSALDHVGLHEALRLTHPVSHRDGPAGRQAVMAGVPWPANWSRAYFTPVTIVQGRALLGKTISSVRTGAIRDVELAEYCNKQVLTFDWPDGASAVAVHLAPKGHDPRAGLTGRSYEIPLEDYEKYGGMQFTGQLPVGGCSLHLAPVAFSGGRRVQGAITSVEYPGLLRLWYAAQIRRNPDGRPMSVAIAIRSEVNVGGSPPFVLVNNPQRIPLSAQDGEPVDVAPLNERGEITEQPSKELRLSALSTAGGELWAGDVRGRQGWIRLFANIADPARLRTLALQDPPVATLRLTVLGPA
jgi:hypothetical protein